MTGPLLAANRCQDARRREPHGGRHYGEAGRLGSDPGDQLPRLASVRRASAEYSALATVLLGCGHEGHQVMLAVDDVVGAGGDAFSVEVREVIGALPGLGAVFRVVEARKAAAARNHADRDSRVRIGEVQATRTLGELG